jgi:mono/diheme cytochrome c family protein
MKRIIVLCSMLAIVAMFMSFITADKATMERGKQVYMQYCVSCHQLDGGGVPGLNPPLEKTSFVLGNKNKLVKIILKGMNTHEDIDGETYTNVMPPFDFLKDQQISDVATYIRNSFGNKATAVTMPEVKLVRTKK